MNPDARDVILDAAFRLFVERGYDGTSVARILADVPYSKGAFYHHFASKEAVLEAVISRFFTEHVSADVDPGANARDLASGLVELGWAIASGAARGIDTAALATGRAFAGRNLVVLPTGLDSPFLADNAELVDGVVPCGAVPGLTPTESNAGCDRLIQHYGARVVATIGDADRL